MARSLSFAFCGAAIFILMVCGASEKDFVPVTDAMLKNPDPSDWLMYSRTYDAQRFSPLDHINRGNVGSLEKAWSIPLPGGVVEEIPIVHDGVMYVVVPSERGEGGGVMALDATNGEMLWHYQPEEPLSTRVKSIAIYDDMVYYTAPAPGSEPKPVIALDARTGAVRWQTPVTPENQTSGAIVIDGKVISGRTCNSKREACYIEALDAETGKEVWRFYTTPAADEPGGDSWAETPTSDRRASTWGLPGGYDPELGLIYWGISNPMPNTRAARHNGDPAAISKEAPADLYSNSTVALDPDTGKLVWYYQHLPGDDWDMDINHEKILIDVPIDPDPAAVKWINPNIRRGEVRDVVVTSGEGGGVWVNDRKTGEFLWAMPFPYDTDHFIISDIDTTTGATKINWDVVLTEPGANRIVCYWNTRNYWPASYDPELNSLYLSYYDYCLDMTRASDDVRERRTGAYRPGSDPEKFAGIAKIDMTTGRITRIYEGRAGGNGAMLTTAGGLLFWGDILQVLHAYDADSGKELWHSDTLGATIMNSTITYAVDGRQYVAVVNGNATFGPPRTMANFGGVELPEDRGNAITVFSLPD